MEHPGPAQPSPAANVLRSADRACLRAECRWTSAWHHGLQHTTVAQFSRRSATCEPDALPRPTSSDASLNRPLRCAQASQFSGPARGSHRSLVCLPAKRTGAECEAAAGAAGAEDEAAADAAEAEGEEAPPPCPQSCRALLNLSKAGAHSVDAPAAKEVGQTDDAAGSSQASPAWPHSPLECSSTVPGSSRSAWENLSFSMLNKDAHPVAAR